MVLLIAISFVIMCSGGSQGQLERNVYCEGHIPKYDCPNGWVGRGSRCYRFVPCPDRCRVNYAKTVCRRQGGELASVRSEGENDFLSSLAGESIKRVILGGTDFATETVWLWPDKSPFDYVNWQRGPQSTRTSLDCLMMSRTSGDKWIPVDCSHQFEKGSTGLICEKGVPV